MEVVLIHKTKEFSAGGATCDRSIYWDGRNHGVVFTSNYQSSGRSITNVIEHLSNATLKEFPALTGENVKWFEHRPIAITREDYRQKIPTFCEVTFGNISEEGEVKSPQWIPCFTEELFGRDVQNLVTKFRKRIIRG